MSFILFNKWNVSQEVPQIPISPVGKVNFIHIHLSENVFRYQNAFSWQETENPTETKNK